MKGISIIMPSFLGKYDNSRSNSESKFIRAVESFLIQSLKEKELIIISHGCYTTNKIYEERYKSNDNIKLIKAFNEDYIKVGNLREAARNFAKYDWISYLDSDDIILKGHLFSISDAINKNQGLNFLINEQYITPIADKPDAGLLTFFKDDLSKFNEYYKITQSIEGIGKVLIMQTGLHVGTWQITHHNSVNIKWPYGFKGEDKRFIELLKKSYKYATYRGQYVIMHTVWSDGIVWDN